jgi:hypothetical protein
VVASLHPEDCSSDNELALRYVQVLSTVDMSILDSRLELMENITETFFWPFRRAYRTPNLRRPGLSCRYPVICLMSPPTVPARQNLYFAQLQLRLFSSQEAQSELSPHPLRRYTACQVARVRPYQVFTGPHDRVLRLSSISSLLFLFAAHQPLRD